MYGYVSINRQALSKDGLERFGACYCGVCRELGRRYGSLSRLTLSYDVTVLALTLNALYEPEEEKGRERCLERPVRAHGFAVSPYTAYAADMSVLLAYYKCLDDWEDDRRVDRALMGKALQRAFDEASARWPKKQTVIRAAAAENARLEKEGLTDIDAAANCTGRIIGEIYACRDDFWQDTLRRMGHALGRFIYLMDAYEDLDGDNRKNRPNPLRRMALRPNYEEEIGNILTMEMGACSELFERLPIVQDAELLRNVFYSGVWGRYSLIQRKRQKNNGSRDAAGKE